MNPTPKTRLQVEEVEIGTVLETISQWLMREGVGELAGHKASWFSAAAEVVQSGRLGLTSARSNQSPLHRELLRLQSFGYAITW